jgi:hypothetical protein
VWTQSKSLLEATLLEQAKILAMCGVREDEGAEDDEKKGGVAASAVVVAEAHSAAATEAAEAAAAAAAEKEDTQGKEGSPFDDDDGDKDEGDADDDCGPYGSPEDRRRLKTRLSRLGLVQQHCEGDGSCLFRAVSAQLFAGSQHHHKAVRAAVVDHMLAHHGDYSAFLGDDFGAYAASMSLEGTWGDELCLRAVSDCLGVVVHVVSSDALGWYHIYVPDPEQQVVVRERQQEEAAPPPPHLFLAYIAPVHYDGLAPATMTTTKTSG